MMKTCIFDIETDGLLDSFTKIHCIVIYDIEEDKLVSFTGEEVPDALFFLKKYDTILGHNIFLFHESHRKQEMGAAIESKPVPFYANIFLASMENEIKKTC